MSERTMGERAETIHGHKFIKLKSGRYITYHEATDAAESALTDMVRGVSRAIKLADDDDALERVEWFIDRLESYVGAVHAHLKKLRAAESEKERIALLRNVDGRTPEEAEEFLRKADELEQRLASGRRD